MQSIIEAVKSVIFRKQRAEAVRRARDAEDAAYWEARHAAYKALSEDGWRSWAHDPWAPRDLQSPYNHREVETTYLKAEGWDRRVYTRVVKEMNPYENVAHLYWRPMNYAEFDVMPPIAMISQRVH